MAEIIDSNREPNQLITNTAYQVWQTALLGALLGIIFWIFTLSLNYLIFDSLRTAGNVAMIVVSTVALIIMVRSRMARPLMVVVAAAASLWGLATWTEGLIWSQVILWNIVMYTFSHVLFSWLARFNKITVAMLMMLFVIVIIRIIVIM